MEMTQSIHFWYQILLKITIFKKMAKYHFLVKRKLLDSLQNTISVLKMLKLLENHVKTKV